jgi:hypothetical protein
VEVSDLSKVRKEVEIAVRAGKQPGALSKILAAVASQHINILAYCAYCDRDDTVVLLVTEDALRAKETLEAAGYPCRANSVVLVGSGDRVGAAALLGSYLGNAGIDILYSYASSAGRDQFFAVFKTMDDERAVRILETTNFSQAA